MSEGAPATHAASSAPPVAPQAPSRIESTTPAPRRRKRIQNHLLTVLLAGDTALCFAGLSLGYWLRFESPLRALSFEPEAAADYPGYLPLLVLGAVFFIATCAHLRLYDPRLLLDPARARSVICRSVLFWSLIFLSASLVLKFQPPISRLFVIASSIVTLGILAGWRTAFHAWLVRSHLRRHLTQRVALIGWTQEAEAIVHAIHRDRFHPCQIVGIVATSAPSTANAAPAHPFLGNIDQLEKIIAGHRIEMVLVADLDLPRGQLLAVAARVEKTDASLKIIPSHFQLFVSKLRLQTISGMPVLGLAQMPIHGLSGRILKRTTDIVGASCGLIACFPLIVLLAVLIKRESPGGPVIFSQQRVGAGHRRFQLYKLRSMIPGAARLDHAHQSTLPGDRRLLRIGLFMRRWNLDELPQFWNVLRGDMSLVGPRPERPFHVERLAREIPHYLPRHLAEPGMAGWAQVNGLRGNTCLVERIKHDLFYIENWSLWFDVQILILTFFGRRNAY